jgi:hypothetical protein
MKAWHWGCIAAILAGYVVGAMYPGPLNSVKSSLSNS